MLADDENGSDAGTEAALKLLKMPASRLKTSRMF